MKARHALATIGLALLAAPSDARSGGTAPAQTTWRFSFGLGKIDRGFTRVVANTSYSEERGYGFDLGSEVECPEAVARDPRARTFCTSRKPFFFSVKVPEGNYRVEATFGDVEAPSVVTVKAESRRLMIERLETKAGRFGKASFVVNVRNSLVVGGGEVKLKDREVGVLHWDDKLTLEFSNDRPALVSLEITPAPKVPTVYLAGDSTVTDQTAEPWAAWGQMLPRFFGPTVAVANHAESGETLKAFVAENRLAKMLSRMMKGDYFFIQFNHNDQKAGSTYLEPFTTYKEQVKRFISEARKRGATPVLVTSMLRRTFGTDQGIVNTLGDYPEALRQVAKEERVALIDLFSASRAFYEALGPERSKKAFVHYPANTFPGQDAELKDDTHFNNYGAYELARAIVEGIKQNVPTLAKHLVKDIPAFDPSKPDPPEHWVLPPSPFRPTARPDGR